MAKYIKKPVVIEAMQFTKKNWEEVLKFIQCKFTINWTTDGRIICIISTLEGDMKATEGDYIIKGIEGEFYPCKPNIFENSYELVE